ncbi:molecular chaperone, partial [Providencia manganoxydans]
FIALPPLKRFESEETLTLRIRQKHNLLAQDRETLEVLSLTAIPAQADPKKLQSSDAQFSFAMQNNIKLFYRPAGLPEYNIDNVEKQLQFSRTKTELVVKNPTPFYVTFSSLRVGNAEMNLDNSRMMAPFSESTWPLDNNATDEVHWQLINDQGGTHDANHRRITQIK